MATVAIVGPDGAGKTTMCRLIEEADPGTFRRLYMGVNADSSNVLLPTTRALRALKRAIDGAAPPSVRGSVGKRRRRRGIARRIRALVRIANQIAEEWYRQIRSWRYQARGYVVLYDRHFLTDYTGEDVAERNRSFGRQFHVWLLRRLYPRPDLIIFLDAPGSVLYTRKGESTVEALEQRRQAHLAQLDSFESMVRVDATRPRDRVCLEVERIIRHSLRVPRRGPAHAHSGAH